MASEVVATVTQLPWSSMITGGIGIFGAFGGAYLANIFAEKRWAKQIAYEKSKDKIKFIREKGEELHLLLSRWGKSVVIYQLNQLSVLHGKLSVHHFHEIAKEIALEPGAHDRLETLLFLYFPELESVMKNLRSKISDGNAAFDHATKNKLNIKEAV